ncbi:MAG: hypothetical protein ABEH43_03935, partial [Flavobacteriales bacterium]
MNKYKILRSFFLTLVSLFFIAELFSQTPEGVKYQAVARDTSGSVLGNKTIKVKFRILSGPSQGTLEWEEVHDPVNTNEYGLFNVNIGKGSSTGSGQKTAFDSLNWGEKVHYLNVRIDMGNGFEDLG